MVNVALKEKISWSFAPLVPPADPEVLPAAIRGSERGAVEGRWSDPHDADRRERITLGIPGESPWELRAGGSPGARRAARSMH